MTGSLGMGGEIGGGILLACKSDVLEPFHRSIACYLDQRKNAGLVREDLDSMAFAEVFTSSLFGGLLRRTSGLSELDRDGWLRETVPEYNPEAGVPCA